MSARSLDPAALLRAAGQRAPDPTLLDPEHPKVAAMYRRVLARTTVDDDDHWFCSYYSKPGVRPSVTIHLVPGTRGRRVATARLLLAGSWQVALTSRVWMRRDCDQPRCVNPAHHTVTDTVAFLPMVAPQ